MTADVATAARPTGAGHTRRPPRRPPPSAQAAAAPTGRGTLAPVRHLTPLPLGKAPLAHPPLTQPPPRLAGDPKAFAYYLQEDAFAPAIRRGSLLFASSAIEPVPLDTVVVVRRDGSAVTRLFHSRGDALLYLSSGAPAADETVPIADVAEIGVVVSTQIG